MVNKYDTISDLKRIKIVLAWTVQIYHLMITIEITLFEQADSFLCVMHLIQVKSWKLFEILIKSLYNNQ